MVHCQINNIPGNSVLVTNNGTLRNTDIEGGMRQVSNLYVQKPKIKLEHKYFLNSFEKAILFVMSIKYD